MIKRSSGSLPAGPEPSDSCGRLKDWETQRWRSSGRRYWNCAGVRSEDPRSPKPGDLGHPCLFEDPRSPKPGTWGTPYLFEDPRSPKPGDLGHPCLFEDPRSPKPGTWGTPYLFEDPRSQN